MRKLVMLLLVLFVAACSDQELSNNEEVVDQEESEITKETSVNQEDLDEKLKEDAVKADFVTLNSGDVKLNKRVFIEGLVEVVPEDKLQEFLVTTSEKDKYGMYIVQDFDLEAEFQIGDIIKAYGTYKGIHEELGGPVIAATVIEKVKFDKNKEAHLKLKNQ